MSKPDVAKVKAFLLQLQDEICRGLEQADGAGHFVKMVHNGIEYADMQFIGEAYELLKGLGLSHTEMADVFAAWNTGADAARRRAGFPPRVSRTVRTEADWDRCLESVRKVGYAVSHSESFDGASSVAVPVIVHRDAIASISVFGPTEAIEPKVDRIVPVLVAASRRIARAHTA